MFLYWSCLLRLFLTSNGTRSKRPQPQGTILNFNIQDSFLPALGLSFAWVSAGDPQRPTVPSLRRWWLLSVFRAIHSPSHQTVSTDSQWSRRFWGQAPPTAFFVIWAWVVHLGTSTPAPSQPAGLQCVLRERVNRGGDSVNKCLHVALASTHAFPLRDR